ncbi:UNVERIFIED_ORG: hypothetical protein JN05_05093 [Zoogloea ramigera]|uniref:SLATT domain-containing protein n=1 Tax=Duganella zoogloeoides TaxID=75659 RepID=UPI0012B991D1
MLPSLEKLQKDAWRTSSARYNAARRLRRRESFATVSFALMSALTCAIAFAQRVYAQPSSPADNYLSTVSASLGVVLLTLSLVEWGAKPGSIAEALHENAEKLNAYWRKVALKVASVQGGVTLTWSDVQTLADEYDILKAASRYNHEPVDDAYFRASHQSDFPGMPKLKQLLTWMRWQFSSIWYISALWIFLVLLGWPLSDKAMWKPSNVVTTGTSSAGAQAGNK